MSSYELHEFDHEKILIKRARPELVLPTKYTNYTRTDSGTTIIDKNHDLTYERTLLSLNTVRPSQTNFDQVINTEFQEFVNKPTNNGMAFLQAKIAELESERARLLAERSLDASRLDSLKQQIIELQNQLSKIPDATVTQNEVSDTLNANESIFSDRTGLPGAPGAPVIQNKLLSKNRKSIAVIQTDGNFAIYRGEFDSFGNLTSDTEPEVVFGRGWNDGKDKVSYMKLTVNNVDVAMKGLSTGPIGAYIEVGGTLADASDSNKNQVRYRSAAVPVTEDSIFKVVLDDNGILNLFDRDNLVWNSFGQ